MKKLTLILSTVLLISSTAALARTKRSDVMKTDLGSAKDCKLIAHVLRGIAADSKDISVTAGCEGSEIVSQWKIKYAFTPSQKFSYRLGRKTSESYNFCKKVESLLNKMSGLDFSYNSKCMVWNQHEPTYVHGIPTTFVHKSMQVDGKIAISK